MVGDHHRSEGVDARRFIADENDDRTGTVVGEVAIWCETGWGGGFSVAVYDQGRKVFRLHNVPRQLPAAVALGQR